MVLTEDVTDKKRAGEIEEELRETTLRYHNLVNNLPVAAYTTDSDGQTVSANPAMVKMFLAESEEEVYRTPVRERYREPSHRELFLKELKSRGRVNNYEMELVRGDGTPFWASVSANVTLDNAGDIHTIDGIIRDISKVRALEAEMLKAQKLESIGILAGGIAHDFNNIMATVLGNISLAKLYASGSDRVIEKLDSAEKASLRASKLTRQLLTFSKGGQPVRKLSKINEIVTEAASFSATGSEVKISFHLSDDLWAVEIDKSQIAQVVNNIVINAIQAMPGGGKIEIRTENMLLGKSKEMSLEPGRYIEVVVEDNGAGITPEVLNRIFDPYFTTRPEGSGLGLAAVYSIIRNHGGCITVESEIGKGSKFLFYLPATLETADAGKAETISLNDSSSDQPKILVMDDEESILEVVTEILQQNGYCTDIALDGIEAVSKYREAVTLGEKFDLVIMDITVPGGVGGVEALKLIQEIDPSVKAIVASGYANNTVMANCRDYGFVDSMTKPFSMNALLTTVKNSLA